jgi:alkylated DNA repair dioxygenase AlkB
LSKFKAEEYYQALSEQLEWQQHEIRLFGKTHLQPRLISWQGEMEYCYSGTHLPPQKYHPLVLALKKEVESFLKENINGVLINYYRNGADSMGWHSDNEKSLGQNPLVVSLSLGTTRKFKMRYKSDRSLSTELELHSGDLLVLDRGSQSLIEHAVPKQIRIVEGRINLTFRHLLPSLNPTKTN